MLEAPWGPAGRRRAAGAAPNYPEIIPIIQVVRAVCRIIQVQRGRDDISGQPGCAAPAQNHSWCILTLSSFWFQIFWTFCLVSPLITCSTQLKVTGSQNWFSTLKRRLDFVATFFSLNLQTNRLTGVGARDACASKNIKYHKFRVRWAPTSSFWPAWLGFLSWVFTIQPVAHGPTL